MDRSGSYESATEITKIYYNKYVRNARAIGVMWAIFIICQAVIELVVFVQPQWIGDSRSSIGTGYFGLYQFCVYNDESTISTLKCNGNLGDLSTILNGSFRAATVFVGLSVICSLICVISLLLFFFIKATKVYIWTGFVLIITAIFLSIGCIIYPNGWQDSTVKSVCGNEAGKYSRGNCQIRWALILAIIAIFDAIALASLAFVLGSRQPANHTKYLTKYDRKNIVTNVIRSNNDYAESIGKPSVIISPKVIGEEFKDYSNYTLRSRNK